MYLLIDQLLHRNIKYLSQGVNWDSMWGKSIVQCVLLSNHEDSSIISLTYVKYYYVSITTYALEFAVYGTVRYTYSMCYVQWHIVCYNDIYDWIFSKKISHRFIFYFKLDLLGCYSKILLFKINGTASAKLSCDLYLVWTHVPHMCCYPNSWLCTS